MKNVLIVGTGTIGLPLIGLLARHKDKFGIDNVMFNKNTPLKHDSAQIRQMIKLGANLVTDSEKFDGFRALDMDPMCTKEEAIKNSTVVIDCTPKGVGLQNKREFYNKYKDTVKGFISQGSEFGFGKMYATGITELNKDDQFVQIVSCNTHNIAALIKSLECRVSSASVGGIFSGDFVCLRRANDISQNGGFVPSIEAGKHGDSEFGTHHARDAAYLLKDQFPNLELYSSAVKLNTQYMHSIRFSITLDHVNSGPVNTPEDVLERLKRNPMVALTDKMTSNKIFSFGRDYGLYGRILSQTVVCAPTISTRKVVKYGGKCSVITGLCFTPQDGNSLLSSIAATLHFLDPNSVEERLSCYNPYIFQEI
jgi:glyceraldehyde-3-phosphate dehydrogenase (NAD(P))